MGDFSMSQEQIEKTQRDIIEEAQQREAQKNYQGMLLRRGMSSDVREAESLTATEERKEGIMCERVAWDKIQQNAGSLRLVAPEGVAIGSPVQQEPAADKKTQKERAKKLEKVQKKGCTKATPESVVLQEKVSQNIAFRSDMAKQRKKEEKKGKDEAFLDKEDAKQNLIRAFSNNIRTDRFGKPIKEDEEKAQRNEAFKNNMEGHMSGVVQWVYQVNLNPEQLKDQYVKDHCSELFQTAERLKTFFDYYHRMGDEEWERGFLNDGATVGVRGKEILDIKEEQAKNFLDVLSNQFKTVLSVDIDTGEFLTDDNRTAFAANLSAREQTEKKTELESACNAEEVYYQQMVAHDLSKVSNNRDLAEGNQELKKVFEEHEKNKTRYDELSQVLNSENEELKKFENFAGSIRAQVEEDKRSYDEVYTDLEKYLQMNYANQTVLGKKMQGVVNQKRQELQKKRKELGERMKSYEPYRFIVNGGKIEYKSTFERLLESGYPADALIEKSYRSEGGIVDQANELVEEAEKVSDSTKRQTEIGNAIAVLLGRSIIGGVALKELENSMGYDFKKEYGSQMRSFMDSNDHLQDKNQATLDYANFTIAKNMYENDNVMRYFTRVKELVGDAKFFEVIKDGKKDEKATNRRFTAFLLQDFVNRYTGVFTAVLKENEKAEQMGSRFKEFTGAAASLMKIAACDTTGKNYDNNETMQSALDTYREMADRVADRLFAGSADGTGATA